MLRHPRELLWLLPFVCIGLITLVPVRPSPVFPPPAHSRIVVDAQGTPVAIPLPLGGIARGSDFLEMTHAPETVAKAGGPRGRTGFAASIMSHIYPQILKKDELWTNDKGTLETVLAQDAGYVYFGDGSLRRFGLPSLAILNAPRNQDEVVSQVTRVMNTAIGQEARGEAFIAGYVQSYADLQQDLQPQAIAEHPRVLTMGSAAGNGAHIWVSGPEESRFNRQEERSATANAAEGGTSLGREQDAERILAMDPDIILERGESISEFLDDPRWQGLRAVRTKHVYERLGELRGSGEPSFHLDLRPLWMRWMAEIAHPDRLAPKLRELVRAHYQESYGYTLSDAELDDLLRVDENKDAPGYARFLKAADQANMPN